MFPVNFVSSVIGARVASAFWGLPWTRSPSAVEAEERAVCTRRPAVPLRMAKHAQKKATEKHNRRRPKKRSPSQRKRKPTVYGWENEEEGPDYGIEPGAGEIPEEFTAKLGRYTRARLEKLEQRRAEKQKKYQKNAVGDETVAAKTEVVPATEVTGPSKEAS